MQTERDREPAVGEEERPPEPEASTLHSALVARTSHCSRCGGTGWRTVRGGLYGELQDQPCTCRLRRNVKYQMANDQ